MEDSNVMKISDGFEIFDAYIDPPQERRAYPELRLKTRQREVPGVPDYTFEAWSHMCLGACGGFVMGLWVGPDLATDDFVGMATGAHSESDAVNLGGNITVTMRNGTERLLIAPTRVRSAILNGYLPAHSVPVVVEHYSDPAYPARVTHETDGMILACETAEDVLSTYLPDWKIERYLDLGEDVFAPWSASVPMLHHA